MTGENMDIPFMTCPVAIDSEDKRGFGGEESWDGTLFQVWRWEDAVTKSAVFPGIKDERES